MAKFKMPSDILVGQYLQFIALHIAVAIAVLYTCGYMLGEWVHNTNQFLSKDVQQWFTIIRQNYTKSPLVQALFIY